MTLIKGDNGAMYVTDEGNFVMSFENGEKFEFKNNTLKETIKFDSEKAPLDLLPFHALNEVAKVLQHGKKKYAAHNWKKGTTWSRFSAASLRHLFAWNSGEDNDRESDLNHLAHAACCILFLLEYKLLGLGTDDRYTTPVPPTFEDLIEQD